MSSRSPRLMLALVAAGIGALAGSCHAPAKPQAPRPAPAGRMATAAGAPSRLPTPEAAFGLLHHDFRDDGWRYPVGADRIVPIPNGFALVMSGADSDCMACEARLSIAYFARGKDGWAPRGIWPDLVKGGYAGRFFGVDDIRLGRPHPDIAVHGGNFDQGCSVDTVSLIELAPHRPVVLIAGAPLGSDNEGFDDQPADFISYNATLTPLNSGDGVAIRYSGHVEHDRSLDETVVYAGRGGSWTPHPGVFRHDCAGWWRDDWR